MECPEVTKLFKYRDFSARSLSMLKNNEIYYAASNSFNDPFDCQGRRGFEFDDDEQLVEKMGSLEAIHQNISEDEAKEMLRTIIAGGGKDDYLALKSGHFQEVVLQSFGICSFSKIHNDILMWSHYSGGHKGFCLEFSRTPENILQWARPVEYPVNEEFLSIDYWKETEKEQVEEFKKIVTTKSRHWFYEEEWRALSIPSDLSGGYKGHSSTYPETMLSGVIFGVRMPESDRETIKSIVADKGVNLYEAKIVKNMFRLEIIDYV